MKLSETLITAIPAIVVIAIAQLWFFLAAYADFANTNSMLAALIVAIGLTLLGAIYSTTDIRFRLKRGALKSSQLKNARYTRRISVLLVPIIVFPIVYIDRISHGTSYLSAILDTILVVIAVVGAIILHRRSKRSEHARVAS